MIQQLLCLAIAFTVVYSDCCTKHHSQFESKCNTTDNIECHLKNYGIHCCNEAVKAEIRSFAIKDSFKIVSSYTMQILP